ncbi:hypothetical protein C8F04DRAFT_1187909 [Mycena alexandri]|uniref:Uncharacterized protein n=1 Tax=Mycena alexandri TaxID=1745969 RepID=A0AAD6SKK2_9AGAR|nr:hypothetical protein C8F04DRAFT_1187909 [Mycena alexandri]
MAGHNRSSDPYELRNPLTAAFSSLATLAGPQKTQNPERIAWRLHVLWPPSVSPRAGSAKNLLREKARERMARRRMRAREDPKLAAEAASQRRVYDANYRAKHRDMIQLKLAMRRDDKRWRDHGARPPIAETRDYEQELLLLEDDRWLQAMPAHRRKNSMGGM